MEGIGEAMRDKGRTDGQCQVNTGKWSFNHGLCI